MEKGKIHLVRKYYLPSVSQRSPVYSSGHEQRNDNPLFEQVPPLQHGALAHEESKIDEN
jgi:hypothetical protein